MNKIADRNIILDIDRDELMMIAACFGNTIADVNANPVLILKSHPNAELKITSIAVALNDIDKFKQLASRLNRMLLTSKTEV